MSIRIFSRASFSHTEPTRCISCAGDKVWVKVPNCPWWPAQTVLEQELRVVPDDVLNEFLGSTNDTLVRFYGTHEWYGCRSENAQVLVPLVAPVCDVFVQSISKSMALHVVQNAACKARPSVSLSCCTRTQPCLCATMGPPVLQGVGAVVQGHSAPGDML